MVDEIGVRPTYLLNEIRGAWPLTGRALLSVRLRSSLSLGTMCRSFQCAALA